MRTKTESIISEMSNYWGAFYTHTQDKDDLESFDIEEASNGDYSSLCDADITVDEVQKALKTISPGKATGLDDIPPALLSDRSTVLAQALVLAFSEILRSGEFPQEWKTDRRIPIYKSGGRASVGNYRLVAIHSVFRKIICTIIHNRKTTFIALDDA